MSEKEILLWSSLPNHSMLAVSASDKFGDMGLVGVVSVNVESKIGFLVDFILSCRVMGRKVEDAMLHIAAKKVAKLGGNTLEARYLPTQRNRPTLDIFRASNLKEQDDGVFISRSLNQLAKPEQVVIEYEIPFIEK